MRDKIELKPSSSKLKMKDGYTPKRTHRVLFEQLDLEPDATVPMTKSLLLLSTPRCGSTLFCEALNSSGHLGHAEEWLNYEYFAAWAQVMGVEFNMGAYFDWLQRKTTRNTGVFVLNWHVGQLIAMNQDFNIGIESMEFDHISYLFRRDKIAQSVSLVKARTSNQYRSYEKREKAPEISLTAVALAMADLTTDDRFARNYLMKYFDSMYAYEDFQRLSTPATRAHPCYNEVHKAMGKTVDRNDSYNVRGTGLKKQSDNDSRRTIAKFRDYILGERDV
jgi:LPS sulfotransferase NodH